MTTTETTYATTEAASHRATPMSALTPYLAVHDTAAAIAFYESVFDAVETGTRYVGDDGSIGHAELTIEGVALFLADESPEYHHHSPRTVGATTVGLHLYVADVDAVVARAERLGATVTRPPEDQPYGDRGATFLDPFGHKWMVATPLDDRSATAGTEPASGAAKTVWPAFLYEDAPAAIRFLVDVVGFEERLVVADGDVVHHAELGWPEGGGVMLGSVRPGGVNEYGQRPHTGSVYVVTDDPDAVHTRVASADGVEIIEAPYSPDYDPGSRSFAFRDPERNIWSFGSYRGA